jgi:hypothetical protein
MPLTLNLHIDIFDV